MDVDLSGVDLLSLSAHKCYGPKGVGALYVSGGVRKAPLEPLLYGGGQEGGLRPGTLNVPGIVGFGRACEIAAEEGPIESRRVGRLRDWLESLVLEAVEDVHPGPGLGPAVALGAAGAEDLLGAGGDIGGVGRDRAGLLAQPVVADGRLAEDDPGSALAIAR